jgi:hypothetical protein
MDFDDHHVLQEQAQINRIRIFSLFEMISAQKLLVGILILATLLRVGSTLLQGNTVIALPGIYDQISYDELARRVVGGYGFSFATGHWPATRAGEPTAHWSYLYTLYLAVVYAIFGSKPVVARVIQAIIAGVLHPWLSWRIGKRVFGPVTGLVSAGISALYIYFFYYAGGLITETFYIIGILWSIDVSFRLISQAKDFEITGISGSFRWRLWIELGIAIGVTILLRQVFLLFLPFLFLWIWWNISKESSISEKGESLLRRFRWALLKGFFVSAFVILMFIAPATIRNFKAFHTFVLVNTNSGFAFFWGNHPIYGTHFVGLLPSGEQSYYNLIPKELLPLNEAELDSALFKKGLQFVLDDPKRFVLLSLSRTEEFFKFWPSPQSGLISNISRVGSFGIFLPFMLYGLWVSVKLFRKSKNGEQRSEIILLYLFVFIYTTIHLVSWALIRYRLPVDAVLLIFAAYGLVDLGKRIQFINKYLPSY